MTLQDVIIFSVLCTAFRTAFWSRCGALMVRYIFCWICDCLKSIDPIWQTELDNQDVIFVCLTKFACIRFRSHTQMRETF